MWPAPAHAATATPSRSGPWSAPGAQALQGPGRQMMLFFWKAPLSEAELWHLSGKCLPQHSREAVPALPAPASEAVLSESSTGSPASPIVVGFWSKGSPGENLSSQLKSVEGSESGWLSHQLQGSRLPRSCPGGLLWGQTRCLSPLPVTSKAGAGIGSGCGSRAGLL